MKNSFLIPFFDIILNLLLALSFILLLAILIINPTTIKEGDIIKKAEYMIIMDWDRKTDSDIDLWVMDPDGLISYFSNKDIGGLHLERDDLGNSDDSIKKDGELVPNPENQEVVVFRQMKKGIYHVNVHFYGDRRPQANRPPVPVTITLIELNPKFKIVKKSIITLEKPKDAREVFSMNSNGEQINKIYDYATMFVGVEDH